MKKRKVLASGMIAFAAVISSGGGALAADGWTETSNDDGSTMSVPSESPESKEAWLETHADGDPIIESDPSSVDIPESTSSCPEYDPKDLGSTCYETDASTIGASSLTSTGRTYMLGSSAKVTGSTAIKWNSYPCANYVTYTNSQVHGYWYGSSPYYAKKISLTAKWWLSGVSVSGVSVPWGVDFSSSGSSVTWNPGDVPDTWAAHAYYSPKIVMKACFVYKANFQTAADVLLYSSWYHVQGN